MYRLCDYLAIDPAGYLTRIAHAMDGVKMMPFWSEVNGHLDRGLRPNIALEKKWHTN